MKHLSGRLIWLAMAATVGVSGCGQSASQAQTDQRAVAVAQVTAASEAWWTAAKAKEPEKFVAFYAMEAQLLPPDAHIVRGRDDIRSAILTIMANPQFRVTGSPTRIEAARSGDVAWETGRFDLTMENSKGETATWPGKYLLIWQKRAGGDWRITSNIFNSDQPGSEMTAGLH